MARMEFAKRYGVKIGFKGLKSRSYYTKESEQITDLKTEEEPKE